jgi:hypothetical protein
VSSTPAPPASAPPATPPKHFPSGEEKGLGPWIKNLQTKVIDLN